MPRHTVIRAVVVLTVLALGGCAGPSGTAGVGSGSATSGNSPVGTTGVGSASASGNGPVGTAGASAPGPAATGQQTGSGLPTLRPPTAPPRSPTDLVPTRWIAGRVSRAGAGRCFGVRTDDDQEYSLYSDTALTLAAGATVRVYIETGTSPVECGPGLPARAIKVQLVQ